MYGYRIIDGKAVIAETEAGVIRAIFNGYISAWDCVKPQRPQERKWFTAV